MYKVFFQNKQDIDLFFEIEYQLVLVKNYKEADIIAITSIDDCKLYKQSNCKIFLLLDLFDHTRSRSLRYQQQIETYNEYQLQAELVILSQYQFLVNQPSNIFVYDFLFNFIKAYYSNFPIRNLFHNTSNVFYWAGEQAYQIRQWTQKANYRSKIFCSFGRIRPIARPQSIRAELSEFMMQFKDIGYVGFPISENNSDIVLYSHKEDPLSNGAMIFDVKTCNIIDNRDKNLTYPGDCTRGAAYPHVNYFEDSFITIYSESIEHGDIIFVTEKTFVPLIQGHFILPFSTFGFVEFIKQHYGFKLPDFIDYSYDKEKNDQKRKELYFKECERLLKLPHAYWVEQFENNADIRFHNRQLFWTKPYESLVDKIEHLLK